MNSIDNHTQHSSFKPQVIIVPAIMIILLIGGFFGGIEYQKSKHPTTAVSNTATTPGGALGQRSGRRAFGGQRLNIGTVTAVSDSSITVTLRSTNSSVTYVISSSTTISDGGQTAAASDIKTGDTVVVIPDPSSPTTAGRILLNPAFGGGAAGQTTSPPSTSQTN